MSEIDLLIKDYARDNTYFYTMENFTIKYHEGNFICGDDVEVFLKIEDDVLKEYSFDGSLWNIGKAASAFIAELIINQKLDEILEMNYSFLEENWFEVSDRRKSSAVLALLAVRNAIHEYIEDWKLDELEDLT